METKAAFIKYNAQRELLLITCTINMYLMRKTYFVSTTLKIFMCLSPLGKTMQFIRQGKKKKMLKKKIAYFQKDFTKRKS